MTALRAGSLAEVVPGAPRLVELHGRRVLLARLGDQVYACADSCAHRGGPLGDGKLVGARLTCPWHGWVYDVRTGRCLLPARGGPIATYAVRVDGDDVWVEIP